jgi:hypothetical protein
MSAELSGVLRGGWFPEKWDIPLGLGLGVVITGFLGDTIAGFIGQFVPAQWLNPVSELIIGLILFLAGGWLAGDLSRWLRLFSFGAFAVGIADAISIVLGLVAPPTAGLTVVTNATGTVRTNQTQTGKLGRY